MLSSWKSELTTLPSSQTWHKSPRVFCSFFWPYIEGGTTPMDFHASVYLFYYWRILLVFQMSSITIPVPQLKQLKAHLLTNSTGISAFLSIMENNQKRLVVAAQFECLNLQHSQKHDATSGSGSCQMEQRSLFFWFTSRLVVWWRDHIWRIVTQGSTGWGVSRVMSGDVHKFRSGSIDVVTRQMSSWQMVGLWRLVCNCWCFWWNLILFLLN